MKEHEKHVQQEQMSRILAVRYTDLEEERTRCLALLQWAEQAQDRYALAFARIYLGDYYVAQGDRVRAEEHLTAGHELLGENNWQELHIRSHSLSAICCEMGGDEHAAVEHYLNALSLVQSAQDKTSECIVLNNLALILVRYGCLEQASDYYEQALAICESLQDTRLIPLLLGNLTELYIERNMLDKAEQCLRKHEALQKSGDTELLLYARACACYYAACGNRAQALHWTDWLLQHESLIADDRLTAFETYATCCSSMLQLGEKDYVRRFLALMEQAGATNPRHLKTLEARQTEYCLRFEPVAAHAQAYRRHYVKSSEYKEMANQVVIHALKACIDLEQELEQQTHLQSEHEELQRQVNFDELTQIYNRRYLDRQLQAYAEEATKGVAAIMLDVDYFKEYNDHYGHIGGDHALRTVADCLRKHCVPGIAPCRYGGDEFTCLCVGLSQTQIEQYICAVRDELAERAVAHEKSRCSTRVTLSIGYAAGEPDKPHDPYLIMQMSDKALYEAKTLGRDTYVGKRVDAI